MTLHAPGLAVRLLEAAPLLSTLGPMRRHWQPQLSGAITPESGHIALTFDDGPDPKATPHFLDLLAHHDRRATFFLLGEWAITHPQLARRIAAAGHEIAVHGWTHRATPTLWPHAMTEDVRRTTGALTDLTGQLPQWYRPPYGVLTRSARDAAHASNLTPVLWTAWGRDWERSATPQRVVATVQRTLRPGGTVLLHDTDRTSAPGSWRVTLAATDILLRDWAASAWQVGTLAEHTAAGCVSRLSA